MDNTSFCICENCGYIFDIDLNNKGLIFCSKCGAYGKNMFKEKEKKMKYFETKIVKVKKEKYFKKQIIDGKLYGYYKNKNDNLCLEEIKPYLKAKKPKWGNWVNGENLDKIKFPCFCKFDKKKLGMIIRILFYNPVREMFTLVYLNGQSRFVVNTVESRESIKSLISNNNIHILKGKITIFDDDMEDKYNND